MDILLFTLNRIQQLSEALATHLSQVVKSKELKRKDYLLKAGQTCQTVCFVEKGLLRCFYERGDTEVSSWFMKEGDVIISIESFYGQKPSYESIQALEPTTIHYIYFQELKSIYSHFPEFNYTGRVLTEKYHMHWAQQLYALRMQGASERYKWLLENHSELVQRVPAKYIASYLGVEETTLSKIKSGRR